MVIAIVTYSMIVNLMKVHDDVYAHLNQQHTHHIIIIL